MPLFGTRHINELIMFWQPGEATLFVHQDRNWNVVALSDMSVPGRIVERYVYDPYGHFVVQQGSDVGNRNGGQARNLVDMPLNWIPQVLGADRIVDLDFDGGESRRVAANARIRPSVKRAG